MNRSIAMLSRLAATVATVNDLINKIKGVEKQEVLKLSCGTESRTYFVSNWVPSCSKCTESPCSFDVHECRMVRWFPVYHRVIVIVHDGLVVQANCYDGKKSSLPCKSDCKHIKRVKDFLEGLDVKGVELSTISTLTKSVPKCLNCGERWGVTDIGDDTFECRNPTCIRDGKAWKFTMSTKNRPSPLRGKWVIQNRDPGRVVVKRIF